MVPLRQSYGGTSVVEGLRLITGCDRRTLQALTRARSSRNRTGNRPGRKAECTEGLKVRREQDGMERLKNEMKMGVEGLAKFLKVGGRKRGGFLS